MNTQVHPKLIGLLALATLAVLAAQVAGAPFAASPPSSAHPQAPWQDPPTGCLPPPADMIGWWPFDLLEPFGSGGGEGYRDKAGINNVANPVGSLTETTGEHVANSIRLDGQDQFVRIAHHPELNLGAGDLSIDAWVRVSAADPGNGRRPIVDKVAAGSPDNPVGFSLFLEGGHLGFSLHSTSGPLASVLSQVALPVGWQFVAVTVVRDAGPMGGLGKLYINDGPPEDFAVAPSLAKVDNEVDLYIGSDHRELNLQPKNFFWGEIDEVELFRRALEPQELLAIFEHVPAGKCKAPITPTPDPQAPTPLPAPFGHDALVNIDVINQCGTPASGFRFVLSSFGDGTLSNPPVYYSFDEVFEVPCPNPGAPQATDCNPFSPPVAVPTYSAGDITLEWASSTVPLSPTNSAHFGYTLVQGDKHMVSAELMNGASILCVAVAESSQWSSAGTTVTLTLENRSLVPLELVPWAMTSPERRSLAALLPSNTELMRGLGKPLPAAVLAPGDRHAVKIRTRPEDRFAVVLADWYAHDGRRGALQARAFHARSFTGLHKPSAGRLFLPWAESGP